MVVSVSPPSAQFQTGVEGSSEHTLSNDSERRLAIKVRSSNNELYRVHPVYSILEPSGSVPLQVRRLPGAARQDKLVIQYTDLADGQQASQAFPSGRQYEFVRVQLLAQDTAPQPPSSDPTPSEEVMPVAEEIF